MAEKESGSQERKSRHVSLYAYLWEATVRCLVFTLAVASYQGFVMGWVREAVVGIVVARWAGIVTGLGATAILRVCFLPRSYRMGSIACRLFGFVDAIFLFVCIVTVGRYITK